MLKKGDIISAEEIMFGGCGKNTHRPWAMVKVKGEVHGDTVTVWIQNPKDIVNASEIRVTEIISVKPGYRKIPGRKEWFAKCDVEVKAEPASFRKTADGERRTPEDDIDAFMRL